MNEQQKANYKNSYIQRMWGKNGMEWDIVVNGKTEKTFTDPGEAKQYAIDNKLNRRMKN